MIRLAKIEEIDEIVAITRACAIKMIANGIHQWNKHYPTRDAFEHDVEREELYVLENSGNLLGSIVISTFKDLFITKLNGLPKATNLPFTSIDWRYIPITKARELLKN